MKNEAKRVMGDDVACKQMKTPPWYKDGSRRVLPTASAHGTLALQKAYILEPIVNGLFVTIACRLSKIISIEGHKDYLVFCNTRLLSPYPHIKDLADASYHTIFL